MQDLFRKYIGPLALSDWLYNSLGYSQTGLHVYAAFYLPQYQHREETEASLN